MNRRKAIKRKLIDFFKPLSEDIKLCEVDGPNISLKRTINQNSSDEKYLMETYYKKNYKSNFNKLLKYGIFNGELSNVNNEGGSVSDDSSVSNDSVSTPDLPVDQKKDAYRHGYVKGIIDANDKKAYDDSNNNEFGEDFKNGYEKAYYEFLKNLGTTDDDGKKVGKYFGYKDGYEDGKFHWRKNYNDEHVRNGENFRNGYKEAYGEAYEKGHEEGEDYAKYNHIDYYQVGLKKGKAKGILHSYSRKKDYNDNVNSQNDEFNKGFKDGYKKTFKTNNEDVDISDYNVEQVKVISEDEYAWYNDDNKVHNAWDGDSD